MEEKTHCKWYNDEFCTNDKSPCVADYCPVVEYPELCKCREEGSEKEKTKRKKILANRIYSDATLKKWKKEDLIEEIRILEHNWAAAEEALNNSAKNSEKIITEQKAEIERLKKQIKQGLKDMKLEVGLRDRECAELQKQVDEYKNKIEQGTLVELPCKVGDTVYFIVHGCDGWMPRQDGGIILKQIVSVEEYTCMGFSIDEDYSISIVNEGYHEEPFGVRAYLTRAEAEKGKAEYVKALEKELQK